MEKSGSCRDCCHRVLRWMSQRVGRILVVLVHLGGLLAVVYGVVTLLGWGSLAEGESSVLLVTLGVLVFYAYYTYRLARAPYDPVASFSLRPRVRDGRVSFILRSHCKRAMHCWCEVEIYCNGLVVSPPRFYSQDVPWYLPPHHREQGGFHLVRTLQDNGIEYGQYADRERETGKPQVHMKVRFGYGLPYGKVTWMEPIYYYYRTSDDRVILDVAGVDRAECGVPL